MKKLMFLLAAASLSSVAFAQQKSNSQNVLVGESVDVMEVPVDKYKVETNHFFDNWFFYCWWRCTSTVRRSVRSW